MGARLETTRYHGVVMLSSTFDKAGLNSYLDALDVPSLIVCPRSFVAEQHRLTLGAIDVRVLGATRVHILEPLDQLHGLSVKMFDVFFEFTV